MVEHLQKNGLAGDGFNVRVIRGAAWSENTTLYFPKEMPMQDYGGAASTEKTDLDYRGMHYETEPVPAFSLADITEGLDVIDYAHWDVQGAELDIALSSRDLINDRFKNILIGTHSRYIEGQLLQLFFEMGWDLVLHQDCRYIYDRHKTNLVAMGHTDGEMFFRNPKFY